ncbi:L,D-transpeptidase family protein [Streptomyces sp. CA-111067]|uniref:L,D-transpeptidase family protein n=1 Tax=Streptomyces sp. CA-111067 TaxID=3240046 RepID=UPI003D96BCF8
MPHRNTVRLAAATAAVAAVTTSLTLGAGNASALVRRPGPITLPTPVLMRDTGGGSQLITATAPTLSSTSGTLIWWQKEGTVWKKAGSAPARFGAHGLAEGATRRQNTSTTPTGLFGLPFAFGNAAAPTGTVLPYRRVTSSAWWCEDNASTSYNRWVSPLPKDCRGSESEHLADYPTQYAHAVLIDFNYDKPVKGRGAGIFLHVNGSGATAGCVSVPAASMDAIMAWLRPADSPHIAIGTTGGDTAVSRY